MKITKRWRQTIHKEMALSFSQKRTFLCLITNKWQRQTKLGNIKEEDPAKKPKQIQRKRFTHKCTVEGIASCADILISSSVLSFKRSQLRAFLSSSILSFEHSQLWGFSASSVLSFELSQLRALSALSVLSFEGSQLCVFSASSVLVFGCPHN